MWLHNYFAGRCDSWTYSFNQPPVTSKYLEGLAANSPVIQVDWEVDNSLPLPPLLAFVTITPPTYHPHFVPKEFLPLVETTLPEKLSTQLFDGVLKEVSCPQRSQFLEGFLKFRPPLVFKRQSEQKLLLPKAKKSQRRLKRYYSTLRTPTPVSSFGNLCRTFLTK